MYTALRFFFHSSFFISLPTTFFVFLYHCPLSRFIYCFCFCPFLFFLRSFFPVQSKITQEEQMAYEGLVESPTPEVSQVSVFFVMKMIYVFFFCFLKAWRWTYVSLQILTLSYFLANGYKSLEDSEIWAAHYKHPDKICKCSK